MSLQWYNAADWILPGPVGAGGRLVDLVAHPDPGVRIHPGHAVILGTIHSFKYMQKYVNFDHPFLSTPFGIHPNPKKKDLLVFTSQEEEECGLKRFTQFFMIFSLL